MAFAETFKALSDPARREILEMLKSGSLSAGDISSKFDMTGATISYHLSILGVFSFFLREGIRQAAALLAAVYESSTPAAANSI